MFAYSTAFRHWLRVQPTAGGDPLWINTDRIASVTEISEKECRILFDAGDRATVEVEHSAQEVIEKICGNVSENRKAVAG